MSDKRMFERFTAPVKVRYTVEGKETDVVETKNISGGGIHLSLMESFDKGTILKLKFEIPEYPEPIPIIGKVIWSRAIVVAGKEEDIYYDTGISFLEESPLKVGKILEYFKDNQDLGGEEGV